MNAPLFLEHYASNRIYFDKKDPNDTMFILVSLLLKYPLTFLQPRMSD